MIVAVLDLMRFAVAPGAETIPAAAAAARCLAGDTLASAAEGSAR